MQENHNEQFTEDYNELDEILNHQESWCEATLGEVFFAVKEELGSE